jgi:hypothetical protein
VPQRIQATTSRRQNISRAMKLKWRDRNYREKMSVYFGERRQDPAKTWSRRGVPNGYTREQADQMWRECRAKAQEAVGALEVNTGEALHPYAREALTEVIAVLRSPLNDALRLKAARLLLAYTRPKAARRQRVSIGLAEQWLAVITSGEFDRA